VDSEGGLDKEECSVSFKGSRATQCSRGMQRVLKGCAITAVKTGVCNAHAGIASPDPKRKRPRKKFEGEVMDSRRDDDASDHTTR
jgi:hypothetical protein